MIEEEKAKCRRHGLSKKSSWGKKGPNLVGKKDEKMQ